MKRLLKDLALLQIKNYRYVKEVGGGRASATFLYQNDENGQKAIVKMLIAPRNCTELENFRNEAKALEKESRFLPKLLIRFAKHDPYPVYYFAMEFIGGTTLKSHIEANPLPWPWKACVGMLYRISTALSYASADFVHRDLHPGNILLLENFEDAVDIDEEPAVRILDFGCNKNMLQDLLGKWYEDRFRHVGAISTWSPEFVSNPKAVDQGHDSWALGVMLYRFLTGNYPIDAECFGDLVAGFEDERKLHKEIDQLDLPLALGLLLKNLLSFDQTKRFRTAAIGEMCSDLLDRNLATKNEDFLAKYMRLVPPVHKCAKCFELVGRHDAKCPSCGNMLNAENCIPVL